LIEIPAADHNDIFVRGLREYLREVEALARRADAAKISISR
jgi:hypothetical protein